MRLKSSDSLNPQNRAVDDQMDIHWFSIFNSFITVLLLTGFLSTILFRVLRNDFVRYSRTDIEGEGQSTHRYTLMGAEEEESGWKLVRGDVFRFPDEKMLFCSVLGSGTQLLFLAVGIFVFAIMGVINTNNRGAIFTVALLLFAFTSGISGFASSAMFKKLEGDNWVRNVVVTWLIYLGPFFGVLATLGGSNRIQIAAVLNFVAVAYNSSTALPFGTVVVIIIILFLVGLPLNVVGGISGRNFTGPFEPPCRTTKVPRQIPQLAWYREGPAQIAMAGFLPFRLMPILVTSPHSAIYIELYYVFASVWGHKVYTLYGILFLVFFILLVVTAFISVSLTYFQLTAEDHRWWWRSIFTGG
jgi:hypothetical protein